MRHVFSSLKKRAADRLVHPSYYTIYDERTTRNNTRLREWRLNIYLFLLSSNSLSLKNGSRLQLIGIFSIKGPTTFSFYFLLLYYCVFQNVQLRFLNVILSFDKFQFKYD